MDVLECINTRRSIRNFKAELIDHDTINAIIKAAIMSPSFKNTQTTRYNIIENGELIDEIAETCALDYEFNQRTLRRSPQLVVVSIVEEHGAYGWDGTSFFTKEDRWEVFDAGIASQTFCLAAHAMGIGASFIGIFDADKVARLINLPKNQKVVTLITIGYPNEECEATPRKTLEEVVRWYI